MGTPLRIALIAHDAPKTDMLEWARWNRELLSHAKLYATKHTGELVAADTGLRIELLLSGPQGGDAQVAAMITRREIDFVVLLLGPARDAGACL
jgi:methylglyoxal synthase